MKKMLINKAREKRGQVGSIDPPQEQISLQAVRSQNLEALLSTCNLSQVIALVWACVMKGSTKDTFFLLELLLNYFQMPEEKQYCESDSIQYFT